MVAHAVEYPAHGQVRVISNELRERGVLISASRVRSIWLRHDIAIEALVRTEHGG